MRHVIYNESSNRQLISLVRLGFGMRDLNLYAAGIDPHLDLMRESLRAQDWARQLNSFDLNIAHANRQLVETFSGVNRSLETLYKPDVFRTMIDRASIDALASLDLKLTPFLDAHRT